MTYAVYFLAKHDFKKCIWGYVGLIGLGSYAVLGQAIALSLIQVNSQVASMIRIRVV
jgi:hypothetical protein